MLNMRSVHLFGRLFAPHIPTFCMVVFLFRIFHYNTHFYGLHLMNRVNPFAFARLEDVPHCNCEWKTVHRTNHIHSSISISSSTASLMLQFQSNGFFAGCCSFCHVIFRDFIFIGQMSGCFHLLSNTNLISNFQEDEHFCNTSSTFTHLLLFHCFIFFFSCCNWTILS